MYFCYPIVMGNKPARLIFFLTCALICIWANVGISSERDHFSDGNPYLKAEDYLQKAKSAEPLQSLYWCRKALETKPDGKLLPEILFQMAYAHFNLGQIDSCRFYCDSVRSFKNISPEIKAQTDNYLCIAYRRLAQYNQALEHGRQALRYYVSVDNKQQEEAALLNIGKVLAKTGKNDSAVRMFYKGLEIAESMNDTLQQSKILALITDSYLDMGNDKEAAKLYRLTLKLMENHNRSGAYADLLNNYGTMLFDQKRYDSAYSCFLKAGAVYRELDLKDAVAAYYQNRGITEVKLNKPGQGLNNLHKALAIFKSLNLRRDQASVYNDLGLAFMDLNRYDSSRYYLEKALRLSESMHDSYLYKTALHYLFVLNKKFNRHQKALSYYIKYNAFKDSLENIQIQNNIKELEVKYRTVKHEKEIKELKDRELIEKANNKILWLSIIALFVIFAFTGIFLFVKRKKDIEIHKQKVALMEKGKMLDELEIKRRKEHQMQLEEKLEFKTKQMATHAMNMMQKNNLLREIIQNITRQLPEADEKNRKLLTNIKQKLERDLKTEKDWILFKRYFEQINKGFYDKLKKINPNLTGNDFKLCALIKLNLSTKEMSSVLNISPESLKNAKYRLKKKLNLDNNDDLNRFIAGL